MKHRVGLGGSAVKLFVGVVLAVSVAMSASADSIQLTVNPNPFQFVWTIEPFNTGLTAAEFYSYNDPSTSSYNGDVNGGPAAVSDEALIFLVNASDGLALFVVYDRPDDLTGGRSTIQWNLTGDTADEVFVDDPGEQLTVSPDGTEFSFAAHWSPCCTDGYVIGMLNGDWSMVASFMGPIENLDRWNVVSSDGLVVSFPTSLVSGIQLSAVSAPAPEPETFVLLSTGLLLGLGFLTFGRSALRVPMPLSSTPVRPPERT